MNGLQSSARHLPVWPGEELGFPSGSEGALQGDLQILHCDMTGSRKGRIQKEVALITASPGTGL